MAHPERDSTPTARPQRHAVGAGLRGAGLWHAYRGSIAFLHEADLPEGAVPQDFAIESTAWQGVNTELRRTRGSGQILRRGAEQIARGADQVLVYVQIAGDVACRFGKREVLLQPGDLAVFDYARPSESRAGPFENLLLTLARDSVPAALVSAAAHGFHLPAETGVARLLAAGMATLENEMEHLSLGEFEAAALALAGVVAEPIRTWVERTGAASKALGSPDDLRARGLAYIDANLADPTLNPEQVGAHLGVSRSGLYRLFEPYGGVRGVILARRLDQALGVLLSDPKSRRELGYLAKQRGFSTAASFNQLFAARFGMDPSRYCELIRDGDPAWLAAQHKRAGFTPELMVGHRQSKGGVSGRT